MNAKITILVENTVRKCGLLAEHGLSYLIESGQDKILLDTGQGTVLKPNARQLNVKLNDVGSIVLSHGHYDHTGGLSAMLNPLRHRPKLYAHPSAFLPKFSRNADGTSRAIGISGTNLQVIADCAECIEIESATEIAHNLFATGPIPRLTEFEDPGGPFFKDAECTTPDDLPDDQALFMNTANGTVVILGCAHSGIINTLRHIQSLTGNRPIHTVIGGMHLVHASPARIDRTVAELRTFEIQRLYPCHCTGFEASARLWNEFPGKCFTCPVGTIIPLGD